ncbi:type VII secretion protein EccB [Nocardia sp. NPDC059240]|uniref:type VII secretion protein EccB n=1 Tax=Nocardia sp. NPDC059240 TaxID=3346786 RepID=UPI0036AF44D4
MSTRAQVNGYRFLLRRLDHALVRRDVRMLHDPMRAQFRSLISGAIIAMLVVAGAAIMAFIKPQGSIGNAHIVMGKDSGALYVLTNDDKNDKTKTTLHPALNLASARLITGSSESPTSVKDSKLNSVPRGPLLGIPGVPAALPGSSQGERSQWTMCDTVKLSDTGGAASSPGAAATVIAGGLTLGDRIKQGDPGTALLVHHRDEVRKVEVTYLIYDGKKAEIQTDAEPQNAAVMNALKVKDKVIRPISADFLNAAIPAAPLKVPNIPQKGAAGPNGLSDTPVGSVIKVQANDGSDRSDLYIVLSNGVQRISPFTSAVLQTVVKTVSSDKLSGLLPPIHDLPLDDFPEAVSKVIAPEDGPVACITWIKRSGLGKEDLDATEGPADRPEIQLLVGTRPPLSDSQTPVKLATKKDSTVDSVTKVYVPPTTGEYVRTTGIDPNNPRRDSLFYIADNGIRYGIPDKDTAKLLGLGDQPRLAPWSIVSSLISGPTLSKSDAMTQWDDMSMTGGKSYGS